MKTIPYILSVLMYVIIGMQTACSSKTDEPANFTEVGQPASIYPDYKDIINTYILNTYCIFHYQQNTLWL